MITENKVLMTEALKSLKNKWGIVAGGSFLYLLITGISGSMPHFGIIISWLVVGPMALGFAEFTLAISRNKELKISQIFKGFNEFGRAVGAYFLMILYIMLWSLLFIVPGIIAGISYSMVFFIMADDSSIKITEALRKSKKMIYGYKWKYFCLGLRFIGWALLCMLTLGIGFIWLIPYMQVSFAKFYEEIKDLKMEEKAEASVA
jgi:uncharacterized membrane protein